MATFFSTSSTNHRDLPVGGTMSYHHYTASNTYSDSTAGGLIPLPATILPQGHGGDGRDEAAAFVNAREGSEMGLQTQLLMANASAAQSQQGLSLSLGTQGVPVSMYQHQYRPAGMAASLLSPNQAASRNAQSNIYIQNSRYLKAARELLDEVVNVKDAIKRKADRNNPGKDSGECKDAAEKTEEKAGGEHEGNSAPELTASERQDLQNKVSALMALVDQVIVNLHT